VIGVYSDNGSAETAAINIATAQGHTAVNLNDVAAGSLAGLDVLWMLNSSNDDYDFFGGNQAAVANFVSAGGVLSFHDRRVTEAAANLPGAAGIAFVRDFGDDADIQVINNTTLVTNGPGGVVNNTTLDGGTSSSHGYATLGTLPVGAIPILSRSDVTRIVDFTYGFGAGDVYYSTIPLDYYLSGNNPAAFRDIYAPNELAYQASLAGRAQVPVPATLALVGLGLVLVARARRQTA
jgi:hypothetical protein